MPVSRLPRVAQDRWRLNRYPIVARGRPQERIAFPVIGVGASAGGLEACRRFLSALPDGSSMAFILVQHLDPSHESLMAGLLSDHTSMTVVQAENDMPVERNHFYLIPPGIFLSVQNGVLHLSRPETRRGARLPFDFLLHSLAQEFGAYAGCVVLSGSGADGSLGLRALKDSGGFIVAQDPDEASYGGMPRSALATDAVDIELPVAEIPAALLAHDWQAAAAKAPLAVSRPHALQECLPEIIDLLGSKTAHDFRFYKPGTLQRRIERRMGMASIQGCDARRYLDILKQDADELEALAKDLLINVTGFFRDTAVFDYLTEHVVPDLLSERGADQPLRIWTAGCSTGEETYSLAMIFREALMAAKLNLKLQVFASDVDADAIDSAREGFYPRSIEADVCEDRLARFFIAETDGYRISPDLRASVVFSVQDILLDPPFSRLDLVSCRNLLIYLQPEAQAKVMAVFDFALRDGGLLLLGNAESVGSTADSFAVVSKPHRIYRHAGRARPAAMGSFLSAKDGPRSAGRFGKTEPSPRHGAFAELCRRVVIESHTPALVLINHKSECLYLSGPTERYLRLAAGYPTYDLLALAPPALQIKLRAVIERVIRENTAIVVSGGQTSHNGVAISFNIHVQPVLNDGQPLLVLCFIDAPKPEVPAGPALLPMGSVAVSDLEQELSFTKTELQGALRDLEVSAEEQRAINEEALSVNEEFQSTNEELLASKEELQSLNEELTALNMQLQETLERQRTTADDLQNVLYSTDVATLFLDRQMRIRFFTPATKMLFNVIPGDIGRPLGDLKSLAIDEALLADAQAVLDSSSAFEREIEALNGAWYVRRILPYRTHGSGIEGVVITFADITERRRNAVALGVAKRQAEMATIAKSRFLAAASHDLRQPLQTLTLLQGLLTQTMDPDALAKLAARLDETLAAMSGMLDTLLGIKQIEAGAVRLAVVDFPINPLLERLKNEFTYHAQAHGLTLRTVPCGSTVRSDPKLLEQMIRNLLSNALKYTKQGKVLLGCRHKPGKIVIEIWDTGIGIPGSEYEAIFEEFHQLDNAAREQSQGLGLGLAIVQRLGDMLGHSVDVNSHPGKGSVFAIEVPRVIAPCVVVDDDAPVVPTRDDAVHRVGSILVIEDEPGVNDLLSHLLKNDKHRVITAFDGMGALAVVAGGRLDPDLILADYNLPNGQNGLLVAEKIRQLLDRTVPVVILTGDITSSTLQDIEGGDCVQLSKPVKAAVLKEVIQSVLRRSPASQTRIEVIGDAASDHALETAVEHDKLAVPVIFIVDDDGNVRQAIRSVLEARGWCVSDFDSCEGFLEAYRPGGRACLLIDAYLPGMDGFALLRRLREAGHRLPAIMITGNSDIPMAVRAIKAGALDFIDKPIRGHDLIASITHALARGHDADETAIQHENAAAQVAGLTSRQREIMHMVLAGHPSKNIAADLGISQRTVEKHRYSVMKKTGAASLPALARLALAAERHGADDGT